MPHDEGLTIYLALVDGALPLVPAVIEWERAWHEDPTPIGVGLLTTRKKDEAIHANRWAYIDECRHQASEWLRDQRVDPTDKDRVRAFLLDLIQTIVPFELTEQEQVTEVERLLWWLTKEFTTFGGYNGDRKDRLPVINLYRYKQQRATALAALQPTDVPTANKR